MQSHESLWHSDAEGEYLNPRYLVLNPGQIVPRIPVFRLSAEANETAAKSLLQYQRPLRVLRAAMNGRARNYSALSAKRKPLSGSPASSRKRSLTS